MIHSAYLMQDKPKKTTPEYRARSFHDGIACVYSPNGGSGWINNQGHFFETKFRAEADFSEGLTPHPSINIDDFKFGYIDTKINFAIPPQYNYAASFKDGLAYVTKDNKAGFIDTSGNTVIPFIYDDNKDSYTISYCSFYDGIALVAKNGKWGAIDKTGNTVIPFEFDYIDHFSGKEKAMAKIGEEYAVIAKTGKILSRFELETKQYIVGSFSEDLFTVDFLGAPITQNNSTTCNRKCGYIDEIGKIVIPLEYSAAADFKNGLACVEKDGKDCVIDKDNHIVIPDSYERISRDLDGLFFANKGSELHFFDTTGKLFLSTQFDFFNSYDFEYDKLFFSEGLLAICKNDKWGYIDKKGNIIIPFQYTFAGAFSEGYAPVIEGERWAVIVNPLNS